MDSTRLTIDDWRHLFAEIGDLALLESLADEKLRPLLEELRSLEARLAEHRLPDAEEAVYALAVLRKTYTHRQRLLGRKAS